MSSSIQALRGMKDFLEHECSVYDYIVKLSYNVSRLYGYKKISTPLIEYSSVFNRGLGQTSDVVSKEMYVFLDKKGREVALRPEFTASIARAVISNKLNDNLPLKLFSSGPLFRYDRPQYGRQRQFHQINFEHIGIKDAYSDAESIKMASDVLKKLSIYDDITLEINSIGCEESRMKYQEALVNYFTKYENDLSEDSKKRLIGNPLRILDSKSDQDKSISMNAPSIKDYYTKDSSRRFDLVLKYLDMIGINYKINEKLVRGLDYYCHTVFEFTTDKLGSQGTILAGGRYSGLFPHFTDGIDIPSIGFAAGIERLMTMRQFIFDKQSNVHIIVFGDDVIHYAIDLANKLRISNINTIVNTDYEYKIKDRLAKIVQLQDKFVIFIGTEERDNNSYRLKNLLEHSEIILDIDKLINTIK